MYGAQVVSNSLGGSISFGSSTAPRAPVQLKLIRNLPVLMENIRSFGKTIIPMLKDIKYPRRYRSRLHTSYVWETRMVN